MPAPVHLRCEYFINAIGIDARRPRLSWHMDDRRQGARQIAYQLIVTSNDKDLWDSGRIDSDQSVHVEYEGPPLNSRQRCEWKIRIWDQHGEATDWSKPAFFEMGLLEGADWQAKWIAA